MTSEMQVIHALVQVALRWREEGGSIEREERNLRKGESSTRPPRGDQVDGLPRVVNKLRKLSDLSSKFLC